MDDTLECRDLYGGAIELHIPGRFVDISDFRPVPDHQEVYADGSEDQSLIVEVVEHSSVPDEQCGQHYFDDLATVNDSQSSTLENVQPLGAADLPGLTADRYSCAVLVSGHQSVSKGRQGSGAANEVHVMMAVVRLPQVASDLLLTLNSPMVISAHSEAAQHAGSGHKQKYLGAAKLMKSMLRTLKIQDWSLFGA